MSIQTDLTRLQSAKAAIKAAIEGKGVTVPEATLLDGMASLIESIEAGGGGTELFSGTITPSEDSAKITIEHNIGVAPKLIFVKTDTYGVNYFSHGVWINKGTYEVLTFGGYFQSQSTSPVSTKTALFSSNVGFNVSIDSITAILFVSKSIKFCGGVEYKWYMV